MTHRTRYPSTLKLQGYNQWTPNQDWMLHWLSLWLTCTFLCVNNVVSNKLLRNCGLQLYICLENINYETVWIFWVNCLKLCKEKWLKCLYITMSSKNLVTYVLILQNYQYGKKSAQVNLRKTLKTLDHSDIEKCNVQTGKICLSQISMKAQLYSLTCCSI